MTKELVQAHLHFEALVSAALVDVLICVFDEGYLFIRSFCAYDVAKRYVLETFRLSDVVKVWDVDSC